MGKILGYGVLSRQGMNHSDQHELAEFQKQVYYVASFSGDVQIFRF